jgi:hypothetical protein
MQRELGGFDGPAALHRRGQQRSRAFRVTCVQRGQAAMEQLVGLPLTLGENRAGSLDVRTRAGMRPVEKQDARPRMDGPLVLAREVAIQSRIEQRVDRAAAVLFPSALSIVWRRLDGGIRHADGAFEMG